MEKPVAYIGQAHPSEPANTKDHHFYQSLMERRQALMERRQTLMEHHQAMLEHHQEVQDLYQTLLKCILKTKQGQQQAKQNFHRELQRHHQMV
ncbi:MAG TPA: hypothetical protein VKR83_19310, partial [Ktedonobacteraceae bacterium]|nr:hypothetical protein [Ktedonobacteraceae bacterium]